MPNPPSTLAHAPAQSSAQHRHLGAALVLISTAQLMVVLDATIVNIALPSIQRQLHFSPANLQWVLNGYALAFGGLLLLGGRAGDLFGRRRLFMVGVGLFTVSSLLGGFATTSAWLIIARVAQGVGGAIASPTALSLITSTFPAGPPRNRAMGVYAAMSGAGSSIGLLLGGILTDLASWRWVLFVNVPIGLAVVLAAPLVLGESANRAGRLDVAGALSVTGGMSLLVYGLSHAASSSWSSSVTVGSLAGAGALLVAFVAIEARSPHAVMPLRIFANRNRSASNLVMLIVGAGLFAMFFFLTQFVQDILGFSPLKAGVSFLPVSAVIAVVAGATSRLVSKTGPRPPMVVGLAVTAGALFWLSHVTPQSHYATNVLPPILLIALGMGLVFVPITLTAVAGVAEHEAGLASALLNTGQQIGGSLGIAVLVTVATATTRAKAHALGAAASTHAGQASAVTAGYARAFLVSSLITLVAFVVALFAITMSRDELEHGETLPVAALAE